MSPSARSEEIEARYEARREADPAVLAAVAVLVLLAVVSWWQGWQLVGFGWWVWLVLALPEFLLSVDIWLGGRGVMMVRTHAAARVVLGLIVAGNVARLVLLIAALVSTSGKELSGGQLLLTAAAIWVANVIVFGIVYWGVDGGGPFERARHDRSRRDFQFPQDEDPRLGWKPGVWDYLYVSLTAGTAFSPTDTMPLTLKAKALHAFQCTVSLVLVVLVTARAVNVLAS